MMFKNKQPLNKLVRKASTNRYYALIKIPADTCNLLIGEIYNYNRTNFEVPFNADSTLELYNKQFVDNAEMRAQLS